MILLNAFVIHFKNVWFIISSERVSDLTMLIACPWYMLLPGANILPATPCQLLG